MKARDLKKTDSETASAKINLALHVRRRLPNGYHDIETVFAFLNHGDIVSVQPSERLSLNITGPFANGLNDSDNLVLDAAHLLADQCGTKAGASIRLEKLLPIASGIGGGSADAAATLRLLNRFWDIGLSIDALAKLSAELGADVPACVISQTCRGEGIGQRILPIEEGALASCFTLLVNPLTAVSTACVFEKWDGIDRGALNFSNAMESALSGRNDLEKPAINLLPVIEKILVLLAETGAILSRMSGSGGTCFAVYESEIQAKAAREVVAAALPDMWTMIGGLR